MEQTTYTFCELISSGGLVGLFSDRGPRSCYLWLFGTERIRLQISFYGHGYLSYLSLLQRSSDHRSKTSEQA